TTGDYSERTHRCERARLGAAQGVFAFTIADDFSLQPTRQLDVPRKGVTRVDRAGPVGPPRVGPMRVLTARRSAGIVSGAAAQRSRVIIPLAADLVAVAGIMVRRIEAMDSTVPHSVVVFGIAAPVVATATAVVVISVARVEQHGHL